MIDLPVHPVTGLAALGLMSGGRPIWPVLGASGEDDDGQEDHEQDSEEEQDSDLDQGEDDHDDEDKPLGPKGEKALDAMKAKLKAERERRRAAEAKLSQSKPAERPPADEQEQARKAAEDAATARANQRILRSEIKAAAAGKLADPKDALRLLDLDKFEVDADGEVDEDEIAEAIDDLIRRKPYLAATSQGGGQRFQGGADQGARKGAAKPITEEQLKAMTPAQIDKAYAEGKLSHLL